MMALKKGCGGEPKESLVGQGCATTWTLKDGGQVRYINNDNGQSSERDKGRLHHMDGESCERKTMATTMATTLTVKQARRGHSRIESRQLINQCPISIYGSDSRRRNHSSRGHFTTRLFTIPRHDNELLNGHGYIHSTRSAQGF